MHRKGRALLWMLVAVAAASGGYIWWDHARRTAEEQLEDDLSQFPEPVVRPVEPTADDSQELRLQMAAGDVFPLIKTIDETITQQTEDGPLQSKTRIELLLAIRVQEVRDGRKRLRVDYRRVKYEQDIAGETVEYDSTSPGEMIPPAAQAYHGLVDNGFEFWIGPDNRILDLVDFEAFLNRCVVHVPEAQRRDVMTRFLKTSGDEGVANFIDDSIGLLPYRDKSVSVGDQWTRRRQVLRPVPLHITQTCTLKRLDEEIAEIDIQGSIAPAATYGPSDQPQGGLQLIVRGGDTVGHCRIRSKTGLPERSEIRRVYDMLVRYPDGRQFSQTKDSHTVIEVFSPQGEPKTIGGDVSARTATLPEPDEAVK